jgi:hypothetical protein
MVWFEMLNQYRLNISLIPISTHPKIGQLYIFAAPLVWFQFQIPEVMVATKPIVPLREIRSHSANGFVQYGHDNHAIGIIANWYPPRK